MTREKYISNRENILKGQVNMEIWEIFFDYCEENKKDSWKSPTFDEFIPSFLQYLQRSHYPSIVKQVVEYYDELFGTNQVLDKEGKILKTY